MKKEEKKNFAPFIQNKLLCGYCNGNGIDGGLEVCKPCRGNQFATERILSVSDLRELEKQLNQEEITYSRMVEILNEKATRYMYNWIREEIKPVAEHGKELEKETQSQSKEIEHLKGLLKECEGGLLEAKTLVKNLIGLGEGTEADFRYEESVLAIIENKLSKLKQL